MSAALPTKFFFSYIGFSNKIHDRFPVDTASTSVLTVAPVGIPFKNVVESCTVGATL